MTPYSKEEIAEERIIAVTQRLFGFSVLNWIIIIANCYVHKNGLPFQRSGDQLMKAFLLISLKSLPSMQIHEESLIKFYERIQESSNKKGIEGFPKETC